MCGRIVDFLTDKELVDLYHVVGGLRLGVERPPRYNVKPTQPIWAVRLAENGNRELADFRWGLIPPWSKEAKSPLPGNILINAKAEGIATNSIWRGSFTKRRALVPVNGFYEWKKLPDGKTKQPFFIYLASGLPMTFAGIWENLAPGRSGQDRERGHGHLRAQ